MFLILTVVLLRRRLFGFLLALFGLVGLGLFGVVAVAINQPLERAHTLSVSIDDQRTKLVATLTQAQTTLQHMSLGVAGVDQSLADGKAATDRAAGIATSLASSMFGLGDAMSISIFGAQPLAGLASNFDSTGQQVSLLSTELTTIATSLDDNRTAVTMTSHDLTDLAESLGQLTTLVAASPDVEISTASLDAIRLAVYAICGWLAVFALGCTFRGFYLFLRG